MPHIGAETCKCYFELCIEAEELYVKLDLLELHFFIFLKHKDCIVITPNTIGYARCMHIKIVANHMAKANMVLPWMILFTFLRHESFFTVKIESSILRLDCMLYG